MEEILVIDDDDNILKLLDRLLTRHGYSVKVAYNGINGIELLNRENRFRLVITDIRMPGADGNQVAKHLRDDEKMRNTPIIGISAYPDDAERELFDSIVQKPFKIRNLIDLINSLI